LSIVAYSLPPGQTRYLTTPDGAWDADRSVPKARAAIRKTADGLAVTTAPIFETPSRDAKSSTKAMVERSDRPRRS
jgi:hypothetical protein